MAADNPVTTVRTDIGKGIDNHRAEINTWANTVNAEIAALETGAAAITEVTGGGPAYTVVPADRVILANSAAGVIQINLPVSAGLGRTITVLRDGGSNVTIQAQAGETVDGALTLVLTDNNTGVDVIDTGAATGTDDWDATGANVTGLAGVIAAAALNTARLTSMELTRTTNIPPGDGAGRVGDLNSSPVEVVPAPGVGNYIEVISCRTFNTFGTVDYDGTSRDCALQYSGGADITTPVASDTLGITAGSADLGYNHVVPHATGFGDDNTAVDFYMDTNDPFAAAGDNALSVEVVYKNKPSPF